MILLGVLFGGLILFFTDGGRSFPGGLNLLFNRNAPDLRIIAVRASPFVPTAAIDPYVHHEMIVSLGCGRLLVSLGLDETDYRDIRANLSHRELPHLERQ